MAATLLIWLSFLSALVSAVSYYQAASKKSRMVPLARLSFSTMAASVLAASALLVLYILRHQFEYSSVWSYSARDLPLQLLVTTFWAGQEGSFLFWALCGAMMGAFLLRYTRRNRIEYETMAVYSLLQSFLLLLLIVKSPFTTVWEAFPGQIPEGQVPLDGRGLNPLLQNFWMIIHPPVLFIGFAAAAVPFSLAVAALWKNTFSEWIARAYPWVLFTVVALGAGLMLGGYWAYGVLGWGGWWGWDPVENSSLVPWIISAALLHTMVVQKKTGKLVRTNFVLALSAFLLVVYSTFLTRSGILGESSVHSFVDPGNLVYSLLVVWMITVSALGFGILARRWTALRSLSLPVGLFTRESFLSVAAATLCASAIVILFGTSWPLFSKSTVEPSFYDSMNLPIAVILAVVLGLSLLLQWRTESLPGLIRRMAFNLGFALASAGILFVVGVTDAQILLLAFASFFALFVSVRHAYRIGKDNPRLIGGALSHIGLALLFLAIIGSGKYGEKATATLPLNEPKSILGYTLTYTGSHSLSDGKHEFVVHVDREGTSFLLEPVMYYSEFSKSVMRSPDYASFPGRDFYIEPVSLEKDTIAHGNEQSLLLVKGEPVAIGTTLVTFLRFDMNQHGSQEMTSGGGFSVGAVLEIERGKKREQLTAVSTFKPNAPTITQQVNLKDGSLAFEFASMNIDMESKKSSVLVGVTGLSINPAASIHPERLVIEASVKPFMSAVWVGAAFILGGALLALLQARQQSTPEQLRQKKINGTPSAPPRVEVPKQLFIEERVES